MRYFILILTVTFFIGCGTTTSTDTTKTDNIETPDSKVNTKGKSMKEANSTRYKYLIFKGVNVLSKTTSYEFTDENDEPVIIQVSNNPEQAKVKIPSSLKEDGMIGKKVEWIYEHKSDELIEVKLVE